MHSIIVQPLLFLICSVVYVPNEVSGKPLDHVSLSQWSKSILNECAVYHITDIVLHTSSLLHTILLATAIFVWGVTATRVGMSTECIITQGI